MYRVTQIKSCNPVVLYETQGCILDYFRLHFIHLKNLMITLHLVPLEGKSSRLSWNLGTPKQMI